MKNLNDYISENLNESVKSGKTYEIDKLSDADLKKFAQLIATKVSASEHLDVPIEGEDVLIALKGLAGEGLTLKDTDFRLCDPDFDKDEVDYLACDPIIRFYSFADREWYDEKGK